MLDISPQTAQADVNLFKEVDWIQSFKLQQNGLSYNLTGAVVYLEIIKRNYTEPFIFSSIGPEITLEEIQGRITLNLSSEILSETFGADTYKGKLILEQSGIRRLLLMIEIAII